MTYLRTCIAGRRISHLTGLLALFLAEFLYSPNHGAFPRETRAPPVVSSQTLPRLHDPTPQTGVGDDEEGPAGDRDLTYVVILAEAEESLDLSRALGAETLGVHDVGQAGDLALALLDDAEGDDGEVGGDDAAADGLAAALTRAAGAVARVAVREEEAYTVGVHDALLHGETLLVVAAGDAEDVALPLVAERVGGDLGAHLYFCQPVSRFEGRLASESAGRTRLSMKTASLRSSSMSMSFWLPLAG